MIVIYKIVNNKTGHFYIGSTDNFIRRQKEHLSSLSYNKHHNYKLQIAYNQYGKDCFEFIILETLDKSNNIISKEQSWVDMFWDSGQLYNLHKEVTAPTMRGLHHTYEARQKISKAHKGKMPKNFTTLHSAENRLKVSQSLKGRQRPSFSEEWKMKISQSKRGKLLPKRTKEHQDKLAYSRSSCFRVISPDGIIYEGKNITQFARQYNLYPRLMRMVVSGDRYHHKGWKSAE